MKRLRLVFGHFFERLGRAILRPIRLQQKAEMEKHLAVLTASMDRLLKHRPESLEDVMLRSEASRTIQEGERVLAYLRALV